MLNKIKVLGSSSKGNAIILFFDNSRIQLDCGLENKEEHLNDLLLISHFHRDHFNETHYGMEENEIKELSTDHKRFYKDLKNIDIEEVNIHHIEENMAFIIRYENETILFLTDVGNMDDINVKPEVAKKITYLLIESNWCWFKMFENKNPEPHHLYSTSPGGHASNLQTLNFICRNKINENAKILFLHKSDSSNDERGEEIFKRLPQKWLVARENQIIYTKNWKEL